METNSCADDTQVVWGLLSSLYSDLDPKTISTLERAVYLRHIRSFDESITIFESLVVTDRYNPIIVSEHFLALWSQWRVKDAAHLLDRALEHAEGNDTSFKETGLYTLLRVLRAKSYIFYQGSWVQGRDSLIEIRRWLYGIAPEAYTDLQVRKIQFNSLATAIPQSSKGPNTTGSVTDQKPHRFNALESTFSWSIEQNGPFLNSISPDIRISSIHQKLHRGNALRI